VDELPGLKLLQFFKNMAESEKGGGEVSRVFETVKTREISDALRDVDPFCGKWVGCNFKVWKESGFLG